MMRKQLICVFLFIMLLFKAQNKPFILHGTVLDEKNTVIPHAQIQINDQKFKYLVKTNNKGIFSKKIYASQNKVTLVINKNSFDTLRKTLKIVKDKKYIFTLYKKVRTIQKVVIQKKGMVTKGDSIIYNASYYSNKKENKVVDLLKKLPGVDVDRKGVITVNGKKINKVLVENETFFNGSSSLPINALPANVVKQFEVIENNNGSKIFNNHMGSTILNIKLKKDKKKIVFGDIFMNGNSKDRYKVGDNLFYYSPKTKVVLINNLNNVNENSFSIQDYIAFNGGVDRLLKDPSAFFNNANTEELIHLILPEEKYSHRQFFNGVNLSQSAFNNKYKITLFNINNRTDEKVVQKNTVGFVNPELVAFDRQENVFKKNKLISNTLNLSLNNKKNDKVDLFYNMTFKKMNTDSHYDKEISLKSSNSFLDREFKSTNQFLNQTLDINYKINKNNAQGILLSHGTSRVKAFTSSASDNTLFFLPVFNLTNVNNQIVQHSKQKNNQFKFNFLHRYTFLLHHQIGGRVNFTNAKEFLNNQFLVNNYLNNDYESSLLLKSNTLKLGVDYLFKNRKFTISASLDYLSFNNLFSSDVNNISTKQGYYVPTLKVLFKESLWGQFRLNYNRSVRKVNSQYFYDGNFINSANTIFKGVHNPRNPLEEKIGFNYLKKSDYDGYNINFKYQYTSFLKGYILDTETTSFQKVSTVRFKNNIGNLQQFNLRLEKLLLKRKLSLILNSTFTKEKKEEVINTETSNSKLSIFRLKTSIKSRFKGSYNFEAFTVFSKNTFKNRINQTNNTLNEIGIDLNLSPLSKMNIVSQFSFVRDLTNNNSYSNSSIRFEYLKNSNLSFNFSIYNVFKSAQKIMIINDEVFSYIQSVKQMPRFFYLGLVYKL